MSSRILKPCVDSFGATSSKAWRRIMKKPLIGSLKVTPSTFCATTFDQRLIRLRPALKPEVCLAVEIAAWPRPDRRRPCAAGRASGKQRFVVLQVGVHHRDIAAPGWSASLRCRRRQVRAGRSCGCSGHGGHVRPIARAAAAVPSGESSSAKMTSQSRPASTVRKRSTICATLWRSLNVGMTTVSSGAGWVAAPRAPASEMPGTMADIDAHEFQFQEVAVTQTGLFTIANNCNTDLGEIDAKVK